MGGRQDGSAVVAGGGHGEAGRNGNFRLPKLRSLICVSAMNGTFGRIKEGEVICAENLWRDAGVSLVSSLNIESRKKNNNRIWHAAFSISSR